MRIITENKLSNFRFWGGAVDLASALTEEEFETVESLLEDIYPEGMGDTEINDIFWFEGDMVAEWIGYSEDELLNR